MSSFENQTIASTSENLILSEGESFAFVSGLGGDGIHQQAKACSIETVKPKIYSRC